MIGLCGDLNGDTGGHLNGEGVFWEFPAPELPLVSFKERVFNSMIEVGVCNGHFTGERFTVAFLESLRNTVSTLVGVPAFFHTGASTTKLHNLSVANNSIDMLCFAFPASGVGRVDKNGECSLPLWGFVKDNISTELEIAATTFIIVSNSNFFGEENFFPVFTSSGTGSHFFGKSSHNVGVVLGIEIRVGKSILRVCCVKKNVMGTYKPVGFGEVTYERPTEAVL